jgi:hypothetical protein
MNYQTIYGPKGQKLSAQGNALGQQKPRDNNAPQGQKQTKPDNSFALTGRNYQTNTHYPGRCPGL